MMSKMIRHILLPSLVATGLFSLSGCERNLPPPIVANRTDAEILREAMLAVSGNSDSTATDIAKTEPTGFANLSGRFYVNQAIPALPPLRVTGDDGSVCAPGGKMPPDETVVVGENNGLGNVLIFLNDDIPVDDAKWVHPDYATTKNAVVDFDQKQCIFLIHVFAIRTSQKMRILNSDPVGHNTNIQPRRGANSFNQTIPAGGAVEHEPGGQSADPFPVSCSIHPWMKAHMITRNNPYFSVSKSDGNFAIGQLPAGVDLEFRVWHEKVGFLGNVTVNGQPTKWNKGKVSLRLNPGADMQLNVELDSALLR
jgi:hypothetical protein